MVSHRLFRHLLSCQKRLLSTADSGFVSINNAEIYYERTGTASETVLCIPGALGTCRSDFPKQLDQLSADFSVIAFDPRGYGKSLKSKREFKPDFFHKDAEDGAELMRTLGYTNYSVLGWSDGGSAGMILASREKEAVKKLVVWGSAAFVCEQDVELIGKTRDLEKWSERMRTPLEETYGKYGLKILWNNWMDAYFNFANNPDGDICISALKEIQCPTLIIHGAKDPLVPALHSEFIHKQIKDSRLVVFPEGKHNLHMRYYEEFNKLVAGFILENRIDM